MSKLLRSRRRGRVRDDADDLLSEPEDAVSLTSHESASDSESNPTDTEDSYTDGDRCDSETEDSTSSDDDNSSIVSSHTEGHDNQDEQEQEHAENQVELQVQERDANASPDQQEEERLQKENVDKKWKNLTERERLILERREYRRKLAEDPSFVPNVGQFWSHDDRFRKTAKLEPGSAAAVGQLDGLAAAAAATDMDMSRKFRMDGRHSNKKPGHRRVPEEVINSRWTHDGYEELCRLEEQEVKERRKYKERGERWPPRRRRGGYRGGRDSPTRRLRTRLSPSEYDGDGANNSWQLAGASNLVTEINSWPALSPKKDDSIPSQVNNKVETSTTEGADTQQEQSTKVLDSGWSTVQEPISNDGNNDWASVPVATNVDTWNIPEQKSPSQELQPVSDKSLQTEEQKADGVVDSKESSVNKQQSEKADASRKVDTWSTEQEDSTDSWKAEATKGWGSIEAPAMQNIDSWTKTEETAPASDGWKQTVATGWGKTETPGAKDTDSWTNVQDTAAAAADATDDFKKEPTNTWGSIETPAVNGFDSCTNEKDMSAEADNWKTEAAKGWNTIETPLEKGVDSWTSVQDTSVAATDNRSKEASNTQRSIETTTVNGTDSWTKTANGKSAPSATDNSDKTHANAWSAIETPVISSNDPWTDTKDSSLEGDSWKTEAAKGWSTIETPVEKIANSWTQPKDGEGTDAATDSWKADAASSWKDFGMPEVDTWQVDNRDTKKEEAEGQNDSWTQVESDISKIGPQKEKKQQLKQTETPLEDEEWVSSPAEEQSSSRRNKSDFDVNGKPIPRIPRPFKERRRPHVKNIENEKASSAWSSWVASKQKQPNGEPPRKSGRGYLSQKKQPEETSASAVDRKQQKEREEQPQTRMPNRYQAAATADIPSSPGLLFNNKKERPVPKGKVDVFDFEAMDEPWKPSSPHKRQDAAGHERFIEEGDPSDQDSDVEILVDEGDTPPAGWSHRGEEEEPQDIPTPPSTTLDRDSSDSRQHSESPGAPPYMHYPPQAAFYYPPDPSAYYGMPAAYAVPMVYAAPPPLPPAPSSQDGSTDSQTAPTAYQANGMVYYGLDPSAMYQYYYYYYPPMMPPGTGDGEDEFNDEGWGPEPENRHNGGWDIKHHQANINGGYYYYPHPTTYSYK